MEPDDADLPPALAARAADGRRELVRGLKATKDLANEISAWRTGDLYSASGKPEVILNLKPAGDGSVMGWAQDSDGRFIGQARWTKATTWGSRVVSSTAVLAGHIMLVEISQKLDRIEAKIDRVQQALNDDRRQALKAAIDQVETALACDPKTGRDLLIATSTPLRIATGQEIQALSRLIEEIPNPSSYHMIRVVWDVAANTRRDLKIAEESLLAILQGIRALSRLYLALGEEEIAWTVTRDLLDQLSTAGLEDARWKARRLLPANREDQPEAFWTRAMALLAEGRAQALAYSGGDLIDVKLCLSEKELDLVTAEPDSSAPAGNNGDVISNTPVE
jgi:hypothetical protein